MKVFKTVNGLEFYHGKISSFLAERGIQLETSALYNPQKNGKAERKNRMIVMSARTMLLANRVP